MKPCISNIAWDTSQDDDVAAILTRYDIQAVELAPTKYWPAGTEPSEDDVDQLRERWQQRGMEIVALQALLFGRPELNLLGDEALRGATVAQLIRVVTLGSRLGARRFVLGSPKNRDRTGLELAEAHARAREGLAAIGTAAAKLGGILAIEPNPPQYGCNFLTTTEEAAELLEELPTPGLGLHLDTGIMHLGGEDPAAAITLGLPRLCHFHVSEPQLATVGSGAVDHAHAARCLRSAGYEGYVSVEMRPGSSPAESLQNVEQACALLREHYCR